MEGIKQLAKMLILIALVMFGCTWNETIFPFSDTVAQAYENFQTQMRQIDTHVNEESSADFLLMKKEEFDQGINDAELKQRIDAWMNENKGFAAYALETREKVKQEIIDLYHTQQTIVTDAVREDCVSAIRYCSLIVFILSSALFWLLKYQERKKQIRKDKKSGETKQAETSLSLIPNDE